MALPQTDNCNRVENPVAGNWTAPDGVADSKFIADGSVFAGQGLSTFQLMYWNADTFNGNHKCQATLAGSLSGGAYGGVAVRIQNSGQNAYVFGATNGTTYVISKMQTGSLSTISTITGISAVAGDVLRLEVSGSNLTAYVNNVIPTGGTGSDGSYSGGAAGIWGYGGIGVYTLDDITVDDVGGGGGGAVAYRPQLPTMGVG